MQQPSRNPAKVKRALARQDRPGENCQAPPGTYRPVVNLGRCEGKKDCAEVCPYGVFEIARISAEDRARLSPLEKLRSWMHGGIVATTPRWDQCQACGYCVVSCPEGAITLVPAGATRS